MDDKLKEALLLCETDVEGAIVRCNDDEGLYCELLKVFLSDNTMDQLCVAIQSKDWDGAFTAVHALKGLAGNMGFVPLFHCLSRLVILIRTGKIKEIDVALDDSKKCYQSIISVIQDNQ